MADEVSSAKIESFCLLAKGARGRAAAQICAEATGAPGLFAFGELLAMPNIAEVRRSRGGGASRYYCPLLPGHGGVRREGGERRRRRECPLPLASSVASPQP